jgi:hypothetical protein
MSRLKSSQKGRRIGSFQDLPCIRQSFNNDFL